MFIELHAPNGCAIYHNADRINVVGLDQQNRTVIFYDNGEFVVEETVATVMGLILYGKNKGVTIAGGGE